MKLEFYRNTGSGELNLPLFLSRVAAGFPSPGDDYIENSLDLNEYLIDHRAATFFVRVSGDSMTGAGIHSGDMLIVDRSAPAVNRSIVVALVNGEFTVKRLGRTGGTFRLFPENPAYEAIDIIPGMDFEVWGVVMHVIHTVAVK